MTSIKLSIISPVYNAEGNIDELIRRIIENINAINQISSYEIILIDDGSKDKSWDKIIENKNIVENIVAIRLSRNFGQHSAISAGLKVAKGDYAIVMDCDLQDNPKYIKDLLTESQKGYDIVYTKRLTRNFGFFKNLTAYLFNTTLNMLISTNDLKSSAQIGSYSLVSRKVVDAYNAFNDYHRHYLTILRWLGFQSSYIDVQHEKRYHGRSSYNFTKLVKHAFIGITSQSNRLLFINIYIGFVISILSFCYGLLLIYSYFIKGSLDGWTSLIVSIFFSLGILLISIGISGLYLARVFDQVRNRPLYIIDKTLN